MQSEQMVTRYVNHLLRQDVVVLYRRLSTACILKNEQTERIRSEQTSLAFRCVM
jgi:hypothetical protein